MHKDTKVLFFNNDFTQLKVLCPDLMPYRLRGALKSVQDPANIAESVNVATHNMTVLTSYFSSRVLTLSRSNAKKIFEYLQLSQMQTDLERAKIAVKCQNVSMSDSYWAAGNTTNKEWKDMNLKSIPLSKVMGVVALHGQVPTIDGKARTPDVPNSEISNYGTSGMAWKRELNETYLYKKNARYGHDAQVEISVSRILDCFNIPHAVYEPASDEYEQNMCKCKNLSTDKLEMVSAEDVKIYCENNGLDFNQFVLKLDAETIAKMCVVDYLVANPDRHDGNWGFYMSADTGRLLCCHPLFDHNHAFEEDKNDLDGIGGYHQFGSSRKEAAVKMLPISNLHCIKPVTRDLFLNDNAYFSFMHKAVELGLYQEKQLTSIQKLNAKLFKHKYDLFEPVELNENNQLDYQALFQKDRESYINEIMLNPNKITKDFVERFEDEVEYNMYPKKSIEMFLTYSSQKDQTYKSFEEQMTNVTSDSQEHKAHSRVIEENQITGSDIIL